MGGKERGKKTKAINAPVPVHEGETQGMWSSRGRRVVKKKSHILRHVPIALSLTEGPTSGLLVSFSKTGRVEGESHQKHPDLEENVTSGLCVGKRLSMNRGTPTVVTGGETWYLYSPQSSCAFVSRKRMSSTQRCASF